MTRDLTPTTNPALNALRHGLRSDTTIIPGEDELEWVAFRSRVLNDVAPADALEAALAVRIAEVAWRLQRATRAEREYIEHIYRCQEAMNMRMAYGASCRLESPNSGEPRSINKGIEFYAKALAAADSAPDPPEPAVLPAGEHLDRLIRYEAHLNRQLTTAMRELEARQARRRGEHTPLARISVDLGTPIA